MLTMVASNNYVRPGSESLRSQKVTYSSGLILANRNVNIFHLRNLGEFLEGVEQDRFSANLGKLLCRLSWTCSGLRCHARTKSRRRDDHDNFHGKRSISFAVLKNQTAEPPREG